MSQAQVDQRPDSSRGESDGNDRSGRMRRAPSGNGGESDPASQSSSGNGGVSSRGHVSARLVGEDDAVTKKPIKTVDDALNALGFGRFQWKLFAMCSVGAYFQALATVNLAYFIPILRDYWKLEGYHLAALSSFVHLGMGLGAFAFGRLADFFGRRPVYLISFFITFAFGLLSAACPNIYLYIACRFFIGVGYGAHQLAQVILETELNPPQMRGRILALTDIFYGAGNLTGVVMAWGMIPTFGWRVMVLITCIPPLFLGIIYIFFIPRSPHWLAGQNRHKEVADVLNTIASENGSSHALQDQMALFARQRDGAKISNGLGQLFGKKLLKVTLLLSTVWIFSALATRMYIWVPLFLKDDTNLQNRNFPMLNVYFSASLLAMGELAGSLLLALLVNPFDRRYLLGTGLVFLSITSLILGLLPWPAAVFALLPLIALAKHAMMLQLHVFTPEIYPTSVRSSALGLFSLFQRLIPIAGHFFAAYLIKSLLVLTIIFCVAYAIAATATFFLPYDTRDKPLVETIDTPPPSTTDLEAETTDAEDKKKDKADDANSKV